MPPLRPILAVWFTLQIVLPFTAPLQTFCFHDLFGRHHSTTAQELPESSAIPPPASETEVAYVSPLAPAALGVSISMAVVDNRPLSGPFPIVADPSSPQRAQQTVLRI